MVFNEDFVGAGLFVFTYRDGRKKIRAVFARPGLLIIRKFYCSILYLAAQLKLLNSET